MNSRASIMMKSNPDRFLAGVLLAICAFMALWSMFTALVAILMIFAGWLDFFSSNWYQNLIVLFSSAVLAYVTLKGLRRRLPHERLARQARSVFP